MNKYESVMILVPSIEEKVKKEILEKIKNIIKEYSTEDEEFEVEDLGNRKLAYEIRKNSEGYYVVVNFSCNPEAISKLERYYRITEEILKFITIRKDD